MRNPFAAIPIGTSTGDQADRSTARAQQREIRSGDRTHALIGHVGEQTDDAERNDETQGSGRSQRGAPSGSSHYASSVSGTKHSARAEFFFNLEQPVVLGDAFRTAKGPGFDLSAAHRHREIRDETILHLAGTMGDDKAPAGLTAQLDGVDRFTHRTDLIQLES